MNTEGSVMVDGQTPDIKEEDQERRVENQGESSSEQKKDSETKAEGQTEDKTEGEEGKKEEKVTDKGTKLDPNPIQQAHQLRANAEAKVRMFEDFLDDPVKLESYLQDLKKERGGQGKEEKTEDLIDADKIETVDDLRKYAKQLRDQNTREIDSVKREMGGIKQGEQVRQIASKIGSEIKSIQDKYPALREFNTDGSKNPEYNEELDTAIGNFYNKLDFNGRTKMYRGRYSILGIADQFMKVRGIGVKSGSQQAQTIVKDKRTGRIITNQGGGSDSQSDETKQSAAQTIAARMKRAASRSR